MSTPPPPACRATVLAVTTRKGGVGKTTTALNLAAALVIEDGRRVLVVDLDSQGHVGQSLGVDMDDLLPSINNVLLDGEPFGDAIRPYEAIPGMFFVTCEKSFDDAAARIGRLPSADRLGLLEQALDEVREDYDVIILDTAPAYDLVVKNALMASDAYVLMLEPEKLATNGLMQARRAIAELHAVQGMRALELGVLVNKYDARLADHRQTVELVRKKIGDGVVLETMVPRGTTTAAVTWSAHPVVAAAPTSTGAAAFRNATVELQRRAAAKGITL